MTLFPVTQDPRVLDAMLPYLTNFFGNPHSRTHAYGWESETGVEEARKVRDHINILLSLFYSEVVDSFCY